MPTERLQKLLARAGVSSRRAAERLITEGHVRLNGRVVRELGTQADPVRDRVEVDGRRIVAEAPAYYLLHKPREMVTTLHDPEGRASIADLTKHIRERVFPIGRLDYHTSGVLLLTNDGEMAQALLHPNKQVPKTYIAKFKGELTLRNLEALREGVVLDGGEKTGKAEAFVVNAEHGNTWVQITLTEGKNRQVHRMGEAIGHRVMRLSRVSFAGLTHEGLRQGEWRPLHESEIAKLKRDYLNPSKKHKAEQAKAKRRALVQGRVEDGGEDRGDGQLRGRIDERELQAAAPAAERKRHTRPGKREREQRRQDRQRRRTAAPTPRKGGGRRGKTG
jgi:23S rRNA pseudouridine2605 synthase